MAVYQNLEQVGASSFGLDQTTLGGVRATSLLQGPRFQELDRKQSYFECSQHDYKKVDFDGRYVSTGVSGVGSTQPLLYTERVSYYIPLRARRPSAPYRLARTIVLRFTDMIFGESRFPTFEVEGDEDAEDYVSALIDSMDMPIHMIEARNLGGSMGAVGISWGFVDGVPEMEVHNVKYCTVQSWVNRRKCIPKHVTEIYPFDVDEWEPRQRKYVKVVYLQRRDWLVNADVVFKPVKYENNQEPSWTIDDVDTDATVEHGDGVNHFVWIKNNPSSRDPYSQTDYEGLYENFDTLDVLNSVLAKGGVLNLDPTLVLKVDPDVVRLGGVKKGSDNSLAVGMQGDAKYLELSGSSIEAGIRLFNQQRNICLEVSQCVIPEPEQIAASGQSGVARKVVYAPMIARSDTLRSPYSKAMVDILTNMLKVARKHKTTVEVTEMPDGSVQRKQYEIVLPPKVITTPILGEDGQPTGENSIDFVPRDPGVGTFLKVNWGDYFPLTPQDQLSIANTLSLGTNHGSFISPPTATEVMMKALGRPHQGEADAVKAHQSDQLQQQASLFGDDGFAGGKVTTTNKAPGGGTIRLAATKPDPNAESESSDSSESAESEAGLDDKEGEHE